jgi:hypothetical protein
MPRASPWVSHATPTIPGSELPRVITLWTAGRGLTPAHPRADVVVLVAGREPNNDPATAINQAAAPLGLARIWPHEIIEVGDGVTPGKLQHALLQGAQAGSRV